MVRRSGVAVAGVWAGSSSLSVGEKKPGDCYRHLNKNFFIFFIYFLCASEETKPCVIWNFFFPFRKLSDWDFQVRNRREKILSTQQVKNPLKFRIDLVIITIKLLPSMTRDMFKETFSDCSFFQNQKLPKRVEFLLENKLEEASYPRSRK